MRLIPNRFSNYDEKNMERRFNSDGDLPLEKGLKLYNMIITGY